MNFDFKKLNGIDLTWIVYPITILITVLYTAAIFYRLPTELSKDSSYMLYTGVMTLIPIFFICLALKKIKLKFKWSVLSVIGMILIAVFIREVMEIHGLDFFLTQGWDHAFYPVAFGFFFLCDLSKIPKKSWLFLLPFALLAFIFCKFQCYSKHIL